MPRQVRHAKRFDSVSVNDFSSEAEVLRGVLERLDDMAMDALREFMSTENHEHKEIEKRIHRARRAIMKAIGELDGASTL